MLYRICLYFTVFLGLSWEEDYKKFKVIKGLRKSKNGMPCSQALCCLRTRKLISVQPEEAFASLHYALGGLRPIETVYLGLFLGL